MPSFVMDVFGPVRMPIVYGTILTAWSAGGMLGPQIVAWLKDHYASQAGPASFLVGAGFLILGLILSTRMSNLPVTARGCSVNEGAVLSGTAEITLGHRQC